MRRSLLIILIITIINTIPLYAAGEKVSTIVIDPGHGGKDAGAVGKYSYEKNVALAVALKFGQLINENFPDVKVIYTRKDDRFVELRQRGRIANQNHADLFVSIHCNSTDGKEARGVETWIMGNHKNDANLKVAQLENSAILQEQNHEENYDNFDPNSPDAYIIFSLYQNAFMDQSLSFAAKVQEQYGQRVPSPDRGIKQAGFLVLWSCALPSVLTEIGFISNPAEEKFLNSADGQMKIATSLFNAFKEYKYQVEGFNNQAETKTATPTIPKPATTEPAKPAATQTPAQPTPTTTPATTPAAQPAPTTPPTASKPATTEPAKPAVTQTPAQPTPTTTPATTPAAQPAPTTPPTASKPATTEPAKPAVTQTPAQPTPTTQPTVPEPAKPTDVPSAAAVLRDTTHTQAVIESAAPEQPIRPATPMSDTAVTPVTPPTAQPDAAATPQAAPAPTVPQPSPAADSTHPTHPTAPQLIFKIQFASSSTDKDLNAPEFKNLNLPVLSKYEENGLYKYCCGAAASPEEAQHILQQVQTAGFKDAFMVVFSDGRRISTQEAYRILQERNK